MRTSSELFSWWHESPVSEIRGLGLCLCQLSEALPGPNKLSRWLQLRTSFQMQPVVFVVRRPKVAFLRGCGAIGCCARGCRCRPGIDGGIKSRLLPEGSRGSAPGSVREDRSRCVIMEVAAEPENFVGSSGGSQMPLWSASRLRSGGNCWGVISSAGVASAEDAAELVKRLRLPHIDGGVRSRRSSGCCTFRGNLRCVKVVALCRQCCVQYWALVDGLILGRQDAWRPGTIVVCRHDVGGTVPAVAVQ